MIFFSLLSMNDTFLRFIRFCGKTTMISIRRHNRIEKCSQRWRSNYVNSVVSFWNRRTSKEKGKTAEGCRKRVVVDGGKKKGGWYVTGDRMRQLLNGWLTDEEHDRLIRFGAGEEKIVFRCFPPPKWCLFSGPAIGPRFRRTPLRYLFLYFSIAFHEFDSLYPPVDACRLSQLWYAPGNTYEHIVWPSSK